MATRRRAAATVDQASVFINCPFDKDYWPLLEVIVFAVVACGFKPRSALEQSDAATVRLDKIQTLIAQSALGIHDVSRAKVARIEDYPRFNMPFELGLDLGCKRYGSATQRDKQLLVLDTEKYRYQAFLSDIAGQDIKAHGDDPDKLLKIVRDWLRTATGRGDLPGPAQLRKDFLAFTGALPALCEGAGLDREDLAFVDYVELVKSALAEANAQLN